jgi:hypothetical protein
MMVESTKAEGDAAGPLALVRAGESVATRFSRLMNATTSPWGALTDPPIVAGATAALVATTLAAMRLEASPIVQSSLEFVATAPLVIAVLISVALSGARQRVVGWLASVPFPVENMNLILNGLGEAFEITFRDQRPATPELNIVLERVSPESFVTLAPDGGADEPARSPRAIEVRIGVVDSKRNPAGSNYQRYARVRRLVEQVLIPLAQQYPIEEVRMK